MRQQLGTWLTVSHPDEDIRRRGRNSIYLSLAVIVTCLLALPITIAPLRGDALPATVGIFALVIATHAGLIALARRGLVTLAGIRWGSPRSQSLARSWAAARSAARPTTLRCWP